MPLNNDATNLDFDVLVYGGTVAGVAAAIAAARMGSKTLLLERGRHLGGMTAAGLGSIDMKRENAFGGIFNEFIENVRKYYIEKYGEDSDQYHLTINGLFMEPHIAESVLDEMVMRQEGLYYYKECELVSVGKSGTLVTHSTYRDLKQENQLIQIKHKVAIDGTYEGDLAAMAGVDYRIAREGKSEYQEMYAGEIFMDYRFNHQSILPQSSGEPSDYLQAYCFRVTLSVDPNNRIPFTKPASYTDFYPYYRTILKDIECGRVRFVRDIIWLNPQPNFKFCSNGHIEALTSMDYAEANVDWPDGSWSDREALFKLYKDYTIGLWYFLQNDPSIPRLFREEMRWFGLPLDEYPDDDHFPWQLYVREARRIVGEYTITEHDALPYAGRQRPPLHKDSIGVFEHGFDCHACRNRGGSGSIVTDDGFEILEGVLWWRNPLKATNKPGTIPYQAILPQSIDGLLVPAAVSSSHVAFSSIRMEPVFMALGQAAGTAAAISCVRNIPPRKVDIRDLQDMLLRQGQVLVFFNDLKVTDTDFLEIQTKAVRDDAPTFSASDLRAQL